MVETLRLAIKDLKKLIINGCQEIEEIISRYELGINMYQIGSKERALILSQAGKDMGILLEYLKTYPVKEAKDIKLLRVVFEQNFNINEECNEPELIKIATGKGHVCSPHDPDARYGLKHKKIGYKAQWRMVKEVLLVNLCMILLKINILVQMEKLIRLVEKKIMIRRCIVFQKKIARTVLKKYSLKF